MEEVQLEKEVSLEAVGETIDNVIDNICSIYVGRRSIIKKLLSAAISNGHVLLEDYPGLGKTTLAKIFSKTIGLEYSRVQFTPDLLPSDITGTMIWRDKGYFELKKGPLFANVILADEINRAPPKTQSALLESMEEKQITIENDTYRLGPPFFVIATQNPIEQEGTYPLPEAQMDRFMLKLSIGYPSNIDEEVEIQERRIAWKKDDPSGDVESIIGKEKFLELQKIAENEIFIDKCILYYIAELVRKTREVEGVEVGSSQRGCLALLKLSRVLAMMNGRDFVTPDDVKFFVKEALSHRIIIDMEYSLEGLTSEDVVEQVLEETPVPRGFEPE